MTAYWLRGDTRAVLGEMAAAGAVVDLVVTSPPFLGLRSYLPDNDPDKPLEMGNESSPGEFIDGLLDVVEACEQILAPHGSVCVELGDTYAGSGGEPTYTGSGRSLVGAPAGKSLTLIPEAFRLALAYGRNPFTGRETTPWRVRNVVTWCRPNPPVGNDGDKFRPATSDIVIACRTDEAGRRRYWDGDAVRTAHNDPAAPQRPHARTASRSSYPGGGGDTDAAAADRGYDGHRGNPAGAPLLDWWQIAGAGYPGAHFATYPAAVVEPLVKAMCPWRVCLTCGEPCRRIVSAAPSDATGLPGVEERRRGEQAGLGATGRRHTESRTATTLGWSDCGHGTWRPGVVLDPFAGSGTTLAVATGHGLDAIGIDLDRRNTELARDRVGPLLFAEATVADGGVTWG